MKRRWQMSYRTFSRSTQASTVFESANPRHEHEYHLFEKINIPAGKVICPA